MKPHVLITRPVSPSAIEMLSSVCDTLPRVAMNRPHQPNFRLIAECTDALLLGTTEHVDDALLREFPRLRVIACTFRLPEHIDVAACTRRGIWVTNVATRWLGKEAEIEAARNILDVLSGDVPRGAMNEILQSAA
jgi:phosphoglycerate dehydrogenase-like enzyme